ncbi:uncharacterized protein DFL_008198 [Arthrobotrys flagrans]|uniref:Uncharacterized protein n=1 Tax=Arthrobotrys flagrans TaxID=97331 RepID=A0A436ZN12_ARTFL|nr:hypothetical protein DFL_008198 [Arthrobotrys flagrans]
MSHHPSDDAHPHESFHTQIQSVNFALPTSPISSSNPFHFGGFPGQQQHQSEPPSRESVGNDGHQGKRIFRPNPLLQRPEDARERRRNLLLRKLRTQRENRAMQARGGEDEMLRLIYLSEKNRWESGQERVALAISSWKHSAGDDYELPHAMDTSPADHQGSYPDPGTNCPLCTIRSTLTFQPAALTPSRIRRAWPRILDPDMTMAELMADVEEQELQEIISHYQSPDSRQPHRVCPGCGSDEVLESSTEAVCFNCGMSIDR